jgi:LPPG:FO 2-phospho-L-lactate transferase
MAIVALAGGVGASKLLLGFSKVLPNEELTVIVNTGDDLELHGLSISPDLDIVTYTLAGVVDPTSGWGIREDTFATLECLEKFGRPAWFHLGDRDLATHIHRTAMLRSGSSLSEAAHSIRTAFGVKAKILPMSDQPVRTMLLTYEGVLSFQKYLVLRHAEPVVRKISFAGVEQAMPAPEVLECLSRADGIVICPSNPLISIGPILAVPGIREALRARRTDTLAVSPIVGGKSLKGPSDKMLEQLGMKASALTVAGLYRDCVGRFLLDLQDHELQLEIEALDMKVSLAQTVMRSDDDKGALAQSVLDLFEVHARGAGG